jgi:hypothetical protein
MKNKTSVFEQISLSHSQIALFLKIKRKGRDQQEIQYLFPSLYGSKAVTKNTKGIFAEYDRHSRSKSYIKHL